MKDTVFYSVGVAFIPVTNPNSPYGHIKMDLFAWTQHAAVSNYPMSKTPIFLCPLPSSCPPLAQDYSWGWSGGHV